MRPAATLALAIAIVTPTALACSVLTKAYDYQVGPPETAPGQDASAVDAADPRACAVCPIAELSHVPCATAGDAGALDAGASDGDAREAGATRGYLVSSLSFGADPQSFGDPSYAAGLDEDCSARLDGGAPALCAPPDGGAFVALPHGIDNAFATQVLAKLAANGGDVQANVGAWLDAGGSGIAVLVDGWSGQGDDNDVSVRIMSVAGVDDAGAHVFDEASEPLSATAYVTGGKLVADFRDRPRVLVRFGTVDGARLELNVFDVVLTGAISEAALDAVSLSGVIDSNGQLGDSFDLHLAQLAFGCGADTSKSNSVSALMNASFDLPGQAARGFGVCTSTSFGALFSARAATLGDRISPASIPASCGGP